MVVLAGKDERIPVGGATQLRVSAVEYHQGEQFIVLLRGERGGKAKRSDIGAYLAWVASLILVMACEGVAQLQDRGGVERQIVRYEDVAPVGHVLGIVRVP